MLLLRVVGVFYLIYFLFLVRPHVVVVVFLIQDVAGVLLTSEYPCARNFCT
jgi:hypothetical protein